ncbi:MAG: ABC transporter permease [Gemmatimonadaceae bacterium]
MPRPEAAGSRTTKGCRRDSEVVLLSDQLWRRRFGADPSLVGRTVQLDGKSTEVIGIMPAGFRYPETRVDAWYPLRLDPSDAMAGGFNFTVIGRLRGGASRESATADVERAFRRLPELYPMLAPVMATAGVVENAKLRPTLQPLRDLVVGAFGQSCGSWRRRRVLCCPWRAPTSRTCSWCAEKGDRRS